MGKEQNTAELLVKCLEAEGVRYIFGIPGEENLAVLEALKDSSIRFVTVRHEQGAAFMADVYGRLTGKAGVCLSTLGPGATNLITGVADADSDGAPLVAISGQVHSDRMHITAHQYLDLRAMFEPITRRAYTVVHPDTVTEIVRLAFKYAEQEKPGATFIDLPVNVAKMPVRQGVLPLLPHEQPVEYATDAAVQAAAALIERADAPVILAGASLARSGAGEELTRFAEQLKIPVVNTMMAKGAILFTSPYALWTVGIPMADTRRASSRRPISSWRSAMTSSSMRRRNGSRRGRKSSISTGGRRISIGTTSRKRASSAIWRTRSAGSAPLPCARASLRQRSRSARAWWRSMSGMRRMAGIP